MARILTEHLPLNLAEMEYEPAAPVKRRQAAATPNMADSPVIEPAQLVREYAPDPEPEWITPSD